MSKVLDIYSFSTFPIEMVFGATKLSIGTAFNWQSQDGLIYLVTNWHNVTGVNPLTGENLSSNGGRPDRLVAHFVSRGNIGFKSSGTIMLRDEENRPVWLVHPQHGNRVDVIVIPIGDGREEDWYPINKLGSGSALSVDIGQDVFILGYPFGVGESGFPVWKRGSIASEPQLITSSRQFMLVDSASRPGMSGSPVIRRSWGHHIFANGSTSSGPGAYTTFIGIYSGRLKTADPLDAQLGLVWRAALIEEIVSGGMRDTII